MSVECGRCGQTDLVDVEVVEHAAVFGDLVVLATEWEFGVRHFAVDQIAATARVDDHEVVLVDWGSLRRIGGEEDAIHDTRYDAV